MFDRYSFVAITTTDLARARQFWVEQLGFAITQEEPGRFFIVDAAGLRLCVDLADGEVHRAGGTDPVIGFKVASLPDALARLAEGGIQPEQAPVRGSRGAYARLRDPDGRPIIVTEAD